VIEEVSFFSKLLKAVSFTYKIISSAEATSNNANLTGILFGTRGKGKNIEEIIFNARTKGLSEETKKTLVLGSYVLQEENQEKTFLNAQRIRRLIVDKINSLFEYYDGFIIPVTDQNNYLAIANFGGYPSITIPINTKSLAINITGPILKDSEVLNMAYKIEEYFAKGSDLNV
ncbi:MAG: Asp-tRNA(Asn)/Glu-tRNA(Gln) amidotransferase subunit GatA, partial [Tenericutes bacterium]|nr:Asp-tRNA(Asn)/Glu-tRNA(Gln) amidotransferase subunit GatA [Mycoplasmatota bacterium]